MSTRQERQRDAEQRPDDSADRRLVVIRERGVEVAHILDAKRQNMLALVGGDEEIYGRLRALAMNTLARNSDLLLSCTPESIVDAIRQSIEVKLEITGVLGEAYLVEYRGKATFQAGYRGLMKLARRSGMVDTIDAHVVYSKDVFSYRLGTDPAIIHEPPIFPTDGRGQPVGAYAFARLRTGELVVEPMSLAEIEKVRRSSKNPTGSSSPWVNWWDEMARKTPTKRLMKRLPLGFDAETVLRFEAEVDGIDEHRPIDEGKTREDAATARLRGRLAARAVSDGPGDAPEPTVAPEGPEAAPGQGEANGEAPAGTLAVVVCGVVALADSVAAGEVCAEPVTGDGRHRGPHKNAAGTASWPNR